MNFNFFILLEKLIRNEPRTSDLIWKLSSASSKGWFCHHFLTDPRAIFEIVSTILIAYFLNFSIPLPKSSVHYFFHEFHQKFLSLPFAFKLWYELQNSNSFMTSKREQQQLLSLFWTLLFSNYDHGLKECKMCAAPPSGQTSNHLAEKVWWWLKPFSAIWS